MYNFRSPKGDFEKVEFGAMQESTYSKFNSFNGVHVFALRGYDPGYKTLFTLVLMQVYFNLNKSRIVRSKSRS